MFFSQRRTLALALALGAGCAGSQLEPTTVSSADGASYALGYVDQLNESRQTFEADDKRARGLTDNVRTHGSELKPSAESAIVLRVLDESDASGRSEHFARTRDDERALRSLWDDERTALGARVSSAAQKETADAGCKEVDLQPAVQHALRDGFDRQLEKRTRAANEGQRTLEQHRTRFSPGSFSALQRLSDEIAVASHLVHVSMVEDLRELDRLLSEQGRVDDTLSRMLDDERAIQRNPQKPIEQKASQERVIQLEKQRTALGPAGQKLTAERKSLDERQRLAASEYENTLAAVKQSLSGAPAAAPSDKK